MLTFGTLVIACSLLVTQASAAITSHFTDVPTTKPYANAVYELADRNIIGGYEDGTFKPAASITRGQAAAIIAKLRNLDTRNVKDPGFKDVSPSLWSYGAIAALANEGIINGYGDGRFGPNDSITRAQMASILVKAFDLPFYYYSSSENPFTDTQRLGSHQVNINILYKMGITSGTSPTTFSPNSPISRAQAAVLITKTEKVEATIVTFKAANFGWNSIYTYTRYQGQNDIIHAVPSNQTDWKEIRLIPMREGTTTFSMVGSTRDPVTGEDSHDDYRKYYVHVTKENEQLKLTVEESEEDILPTEVQLLSTKEQVKKISLATLEGEIIQQEVKLNTCSSEFYRHLDTCFSINNPGDYIATVHYPDGKEVRHAIRASVHESSFYLAVQSFEERPTVTIDLGGSASELGDHVIPKGGEKVALVKRDKNSTAFNIEGVSEGSLRVTFPNSTGAIEELNIRVLKLGPIVNVLATKSDKYH